MSDIARDAGVSKGAVYLHWESKEALFEALILRESERIVEDMLRRIESDPEAGSVFSLYQYGIVTILENPLMHAVMTKDVRVLGDFARRWGQAHSGHVSEGQLFRLEMVKQLQSANVIRADLDASVLAYIFALIRYGFLTVHQVIGDDQTPPLSEVGKTLALLLERALSPEGGADREAGRQVLEHTLAMLRQWVHQLRQERTAHED